MKAGLAVSLGCATALISGNLVQAAAPSVSAGTAKYVLEHWQNEFGELEKEIEETGGL